MAWVSTFAVSTKHLMALASWAGVMLKDFLRRVAGEEQAHMCTDHQTEQPNPGPGRYLVPGVAPVGPGKGTSEAGTL